MINSLMQVYIPVIMSLCLHAHVAGQPAPKSRGNLGVMHNPLSSRQNDLELLLYFLFTLLSQLVYLFYCCASFRLCKCYFYLSVFFLIPFFPPLYCQTLYCLLLLLFFWCVFVCVWWFYICWWINVQRGHNLPVGCFTDITKKTKLCMQGSFGKEQKLQYSDKISWKICGSCVSIVYILGRREGLI